MGLFINCSACSPCSSCVCPENSLSGLVEQMLLLLPPALVWCKELLKPCRVNSLEAQLREAASELEKCQRQLQESQVSSCISWHSVPACCQTA